ncbi:MAG TPA: FHA domain-containing protein [Pseudonocardiaceae bacterium]|nr:FHA domain-containing protein [Pseudonocardiaceae bacterium]
MERRTGATVSFGRNISEVDVGIGGDDDRVSRRHGVLMCVGGRWTLRNVGKLPISLPSSQMIFPESEPFVLPDGYTPLFIRSPSGREHLLEIRIAGAAASTPRRPNALTNTAPRWSLTADEKLVLIVLGQRYLRHEDHPQPLSWRQVADELEELRPGDGWTAKRAEHIGVAVRKRLSSSGVAGLTRDEVGDPVGNALNHNMLVELVSSAVLVPPDLRVLDELEDV